MYDSYLEFQPFYLNPGESLRLNAMVSGKPNISVDSRVPKGTEIRTTEMDAERVQPMEQTARLTRDVRPAKHKDVGFG